MRAPTRSGKVRIALACLALVPSGCSRPGPEDATPEQICDRNGPDAGKDAPPLARQACIKGFEELQKRNPTGYACTRRCVFAVTDPGSAAGCESVCASDPSFVCPGLKEQDRSSSADEITQNIARCISRRGSFVAERDPAKLRCVMACHSKTDDLAQLEQCWTKSCE